MVRLLVIDDARGARCGVVAALASEWCVVVATSAADGLRVVCERRPDLVVLDLSGRDLKGSGLIAKVRAVAREVPVIVVSSDDRESSLISALDAGADDCVSPSLSVSALLARVRAVLRRGGRGPTRRPVAKCGGLRIDLLGRIAELDGQHLPLSPKEFDLLAYMAWRAGEVISKRELLAEVWHAPCSKSDRTVDVHVSWLRRKLRENGQDPRYLHTVRGGGLRLDAPEPRSSCQRDRCWGDEAPRLPARSCMRAAGWFGPSAT